PLSGLPLVPSWEPGHCTALARGLAQSAYARLRTGCGWLKQVTLMVLCTGLINTARPRSFSAVSSPVFALLFPSPRALTGLTPLNLRSGQPSVQPVGTLLSSG